MDKEYSEGEDVGGGRGGAHHHREVVRDESLPHTQLLLLAQVESDTGLCMLQQSLTSSGSG